MKTSSFARLLLALPAALLLLSCTTLPAERGGPVGPAFDPSAFAYARLDARMTEALLPSILPEETSAENRASILGIVRKLEALELALTHAEAQGGAGGFVKVEAALEGKLPRLGLSWILRRGGGWDRIGPSTIEGWRSPAPPLGLGLDLSVPGKRLALAATAGGPAFFLRSRGGLGPALSPPPPPSEGPGCDLYVWLPSPLEGLGFLGGDFARIVAGTTLPLKALVLEGTLGATADEKGIAGISSGDKGLRLILRTTVHFVFASPESASLLFPALRIAWSFAAPRLHPDLPPRPAFTREGTSVKMEGIVIKVADLTALIRRLSQDDAAPPRGPEPKLSERR